MLDSKLINALRRISYGDRLSVYFVLCLLSIQHMQETATGRPLSIDKASVGQQPERGE